MISRTFETIQLRAGMELMTLVVPTTKLYEITDVVSKLDWSKDGTFTKLETLLLKSNGFIREY